MVPMNPFTSGLTSDGDAARLIDADIGGVALTRDEETTLWGWWSTSPFG
jgi:hypothetical protein